MTLTQRERGPSKRASLSRGAVGCQWTIAPPWIAQAIRYSMIAQAVSP